MRLHTRAAFFSQANYGGYKGRLCVRFGCLDLLLFIIALLKLVLFVVDVSALDYGISLMSALGDMPAGAELILSRVFDAQGCR